jgi:hypothetical protein
MALKENDAMRVLRVRQLFEVRSAEERTETGVLVFYSWLEKHYPHLLPRGPGDSYERFKIDLTGLFK